MTHIAEIFNELVHQSVDKPIFDIYKTIRKWYQNEVQDILVNGDFRWTEPIGIDERFYRTAQWSFDRENKILIQGPFVAERGEELAVFQFAQAILSNTQDDEKKYKMEVIYAKKHKEENDWFWRYGSQYLGYYHTFVRFYFSLNGKINQIESFIDNLENTLNVRQIPFFLKYLQKAADYSRADSAVLYVQQKHYQIAWFSVQEAEEMDKTVFKNTTPKLTHGLSNGISFAEDPLGLHDPSSFGDTWSLLITTAYEEARITQPPNFETFKRSIEAKGYNLEETFRNANTQFPYDFLRLPSHSKQPIIYKSIPEQVIAKIAYRICREALWIDTQCRWIDVTQPNGTIQYRILDEGAHNEISGFLKEAFIFLGSQDSMIDFVAGKASSIQHISNNPKLEFIKNIPIEELEGIVLNDYPLSAILTTKGFSVRTDNGWSGIGLFLLKHYNSK